MWLSVKLLSVLCCVLLMACDFKLQEQPVNLIGNNFVVVNYSNNKALLNELTNRIRLSGGTVEPDVSKNKNALRISLDNFNTTKRMLASGNYGQGQVFILSSCVDLGVNSMPKTQICTRRRVSEDYNQQLSNLKAISNLHTSMQSDLVTLILLKIGSAHDKP